MADKAQAVNPQASRMAALRQAGKALKAAKPPVACAAKRNKPAIEHTVEENRAYLVQLRNELLRNASAGRWHDGEAKEWSRIAHEQRVMLMLLAGLDGDLQTLATRAWREFTPPERSAIKSEIRAAKRAFGGLAALCSRVQ